jgi:hypothetical protein
VTDRDAASGPSADELERLVRLAHGGARETATEAFLTLTKLRRTSADLDRRIQRAWDEFQRSGDPHARAAAESREAHARREHEEWLARAVEDDAARGPIASVRTVRKCGIAVERRQECPRTWAEMAATSDPDVRRCAQCDDFVYFCRSDAETLEHAFAGHCIAREEPSEAELPDLVIGRPRSFGPTPREERALALWSREHAIAAAIGSEQRSVGARCPECTFPISSGQKRCGVCGVELAPR